MKSSIVTLIFSAMSLVSAKSMASNVCLGETNSGKLIKVEMVTVGTAGSLQSYSVQVADAKGKEILSQSGDRAGQFASVMRDKKAVVVLGVIGENADVFLNYVGTDFSEIEYKKGMTLLQILKDSRRVKEKGNSLIIYSNTSGVSNIELSDIVCSLDHDV